MLIGLNDQYYNVRVRDSFVPWRKALYYLVPLTSRRKFQTERMLRGRSKMIVTHVK